MHSKDAPHKYRAIDLNNYFIGNRLHKLHPTQHIEAPEPIFDKETQKAKWDSTNEAWIIEDIVQEKE